MHRGTAHFAKLLQGIDEFVGAQPAVLCTDLTCKGVHDNMHVPVQLFPCKVALVEGTQDMPKLGHRILFYSMREYSSLCSSLALHLFLLKAEGRNEV
eukprot:scaffold142687_cov16-Tisochrysis_lutea.AAC.1